MLGFVLGSALFSLGCSDSLEPVYRIERLRMIASRTDLAAQPGVAAPTYGDTVDLTLRFAHPGATPEMVWNAAACVPAPLSFGVPFCLDASLRLPCATCEQPTPSSEDPLITFSVPLELQDAGVTDLVVLGALCAGGLALDGEDFEALLRGDTSADTRACQGSTGEGELFSVRIALNTQSTANRHPEIAMLERTRLSGERVVWTAQADPSEPAIGCLSLAVPQISSRTPTMGLALSTTLESYEEVSDDSTDREEVQLSWRVTAGQLNRSFSFIESSFPEATNVWAPPQEVDPSGQLVRFHFVLRDGRGGTHWQERAICVVP